MTPMTQVFASSFECETGSDVHFDEIVGRSEALKIILREIETVAPADATQSTAMHSATSALRRRDRDGVCARLRSGTRPLSGTVRGCAINTCQGNVARRCRFRCALAQCETPNGQPAAGIQTVLTLTNS